jgi:hypothetical protein
VLRPTLPAGFVAADGWRVEMRHQGPGIVGLDLSTDRLRRIRFVRARN